MSKKLRNSNQKMDKESNKRAQKMFHLDEHIHPPPPLGRPPFGFSHPFGPPPPPGMHPPPIPPFPMDRQSFKEIRQMIILIMILDKREGITGYQLQEQYNLPRGTLLRDLDEFEYENLAGYQEKIINGRAQKIYNITETGKKYLEELKANWAVKFAMMSEMAPPEKYAPDEYGFPFFSEGKNKNFFEAIKNFKTKEDALDFLHGVRAWLSSNIYRLDKRKEIFEKTKSKISKLISEVEIMEKININKILEAINELKSEIAI
ncbi:MAG: hypothetical protein EU539_09240 [Promethearchaeota archaeon]|nr:MAG: hypothetical protein EU539_09240 [Candidatus Lokiarchaeota archaeon]